jgi:hypothetical protein
MRCISFCAVLLGIVASLMLGSVALAQEATPAATFPTTLGLPEMRITITDSGFDAPSEIPAGYVLLTVTNGTSDTQNAADADFVQPPSGTSIDEVAAFFGPQAATPISEQTAVPAWAYKATWAGGTIVPPGETMQAVVNLSPGDWLLLNDSPGASQQPQPLTVTGAAASPTTAEELSADVNVQLQEFAFLGLDQPIPAGPHVWKFTNIGEQPHIMILFRGPNGITMDQVMTLLQMPENATPPPSIPYQESDFDYNLPGLAVLSAGQEAWLALDLEPGTYIALCFVPDQQTGAPHALLGMVQIFTVGEGAATPAA